MRSPQSLAHAANTASLHYVRPLALQVPITGRLGEIAEKRGVPRAQIALAWMLSKPVVTAPIVGATKMHHLKDAVAALELKLTVDEIAALEEPYTPHPVLGFS